MELRIKKLDPTAKLPTKGRETDAGVDFYCVLDNDFDVFHDGSYVSINPGETKKFHTGVALAIPPGYYMQLHTRSGMSAKGFHVGGGVIDEEYRGEVIVVLQNIGKERLVVGVGDKIAQGVLIQVPKVDLIQVEELDSTSRGSQGFGSSGN